MKKTLYIILAATLLLSLSVSAACGEKDDLGKQTLDYLEQKYEKDTFVLSEVPKNKSLTGRYELAAQSSDDGIDFEVYIYAFFITDSYSVTKANIRAGEKVRKLLTEETLEGIENIVVYPVYDDGGTDYRFTSLPIDCEDTLNEISSIVLAGTDDTAAAAKEIGSIVNELNDGGVSLDKICFTFDFSGYTVTIDTDAEYVLSLDGEQLTELVGRNVDGAVAKAKEAENIFAERSVKIALNSESETEATEASESATEGAKK